MTQQSTPQELEARAQAWRAKYEAKQALKANGVETPHMPSHKAELLRALLREKARRHLKAVNMYRPMGRQKEFHVSNAPERLALGSNRGGKTACCAVEVAWAALGCHPYIKYPTADLRIICVAKDQTKIGEVMYRKLFRAGSFMMVKGRDGMFRAWNPKIDGYDRSKLKPALPLIPPSEIKKIAWDKKSINCPKLVTLKNGCEISFYTSLGSPPNGVDVDIVWFDEEIEGKEWYDEMAARLLDRAGRFIWSATPQSATEKLHDLHEASETEKDNPNPRIEEFHFLLDDNPFIPPEQKEIFKAKAAMDPDEYKVRVLGQFLILSHRVYPNFARAHHTCKAFEIPQKWCRYMVLDPGFANICAVFFAVPPPDDPNYGHVFAYDELHVQAMDAKMFAQLLKHKVGTQSIQAFLIDAHGARRTEVVGKSIGLQFAEQFEAAGIESIETGSNFLMIGGAQEQFGRETLKHQVQQTRSWLWPRDDLGGRPILQIFSDTCPTLIEQMVKYKNKVDKGKPTDQPDGREYSHGPDCVRYACLHGVAFVEPKKPRKKASGAVKAMAAKRKKKRNAEGNFILMGSGAR